MMYPLRWLILLLSLLSSPLPAAEPAAAGVQVNGRVLSGAELDALARLAGYRIPPGDYWYDPFAGLWGYRNGPAQGRAVAGIALGGALPSHASGRTGTGVYVNGRELHPLDLQALRRCTPVYPGRYWLAANGIGGYEFGPAAFDLTRLCASRDHGGGSGLSSYGSVVAGEGFIGFIDSEGRSFSSGR